MNGELFVLLYAVVASCATVGLGIAWGRSLQRVRELERAMLPPISTAREEAAPIDDLSRQMEALADQVDRLVEGQEFLARVVAERGPRGARRLGEPPRPVTPH